MLPKIKDQLRARQVLHNDPIEALIRAHDDYHGPVGVLIPTAQSKDKKVTTYAWAWRKATGELEAGSLGNALLKLAKVLEDRVSTWPIRVECYTDRKSTSWELDQTPFYTSRKRGTPC